MLPPSAPAIRIGIVDDHPAIAAAIQAAVDRGPGPAAFRVVGVARTPAEAIRLVERQDDDRPDVLLCDLQLRAGADGLDVIRAARDAGCRVIVLTAFDRSSLMRASFEQGAAGFISKASELDEILAAIQTVASGGSAFSAASLDAARYAARPPSAREVAVIAGLHRGATSEEIGAHLGISPRTVESHLRRMFDRYGVLSRTELAVLAIREGWLDA